MALTLTLPLLLAQLFTMPGEQIEAPRPVTATQLKYLEVIEQNAHIVYPAVGILALLLIAAGILQAWRTQDIDGLQKTELRREVLLELRRQLSGLPAELLARRLDIEPFRMVKLLEEMQRDGVLVSHTNTHRLTVWRVKGVGPEQSSGRRATR
jgi:hypothetical protein